MLIHFIHFAENHKRDFASLKFPVPRFPKFFILNILFISDTSGQYFLHFPYL